MAKQMLQRRGTLDQWQSLNPVLGPGEVGVIIDPVLGRHTMIVGDGARNFDDLYSAHQHKESADMQVSVDPDTRPSGSSIVVFRTETTPNAAETGDWWDPITLADLRVRGLNNQGDPYWHSLSSSGNILVQETEQDPIPTRPEGALPGTVIWSLLTPPDGEPEPLDIVINRTGVPWE